MNMFFAPFFPAFVALRLAEFNIEVFENLMLEFIR